MASPGTIRFVEINTTPAAPPVGSAIVYVKTDNVVYLQDSNGIEVALGTASGITSLSGEATGTGPGNAVVTLSNSAVIGKVLTGFTSGPNSTVLATDTLIQAIQKLQAQVSAGAGSAITSLTGDVSATGPGAAGSTVNTVGGKSAAAISTSVDDTQAATSINTASTLVERDASGNFAANVITANLSGNATTATTATNFSGSLSGDVTGTQSATVVSTVGGKSAAAISTVVDDVQAATSINTASTIVERDASGNFSANTITANLTGTASGNEPPITATSAADYYRGDKTFQPLNKAAVGLANVDNTSDANKPVSTAQAAAIAVVQADVDTHEADLNNPHAVTKAQVGLGNVDNTSDINKPVSTAQAAADAAVQSFSIQRANHTGTQTASTISDFTEAAQDSVGSILTDTSTIDFSYNDAGNTISADVVDGSITNVKIGAGVDAAKIANGSVSNAEFQYLDGVTSPIQTQINAITSANTVDVTVTDTNTVDFTLTGQNIQASVKISNATITSDVNGIKVGTVPAAQVSGLAAVATSGDKADVGLGNVDNTSDLDKPISTATQAALDLKMRYLPSSDVREVWVSAAGGSDGSGDGSFGNPYQTLVNACGVVRGQSPDVNNPWIIYLMAGVYNEPSNIEIPVHTFILGRGHKSTILNGAFLNLAPEWSQTDVAGGVSGLYVTDGITLDLNALGGGGGKNYIFLKDVKTPQSVFVSGRSSGEDYVVFDDVEINKTLELNDCRPSFFNSTFRDRVDFNAINAPADGQTRDCIFLARLNIGDGGSANSNQQTLIGCQMYDTVNVDGSNASFIADASSMPQSSSISLSSGATIQRLSDIYAQKYSPFNPADWTVVPSSAQEGLDTLASMFGGVAPASHGTRHSPTGPDPIPTAVAITLLPDQSNQVGTSGSVSRADHRHNIPSGTPVQISTSNFPGAAASFALSDHVHSHGNQTNGALHAAATTSVNGFMSAADKTKLDNATSANTASTIVLRDASGNFSAGTINAAYTGSIAGNLANTATGHITVPSGTTAQRPGSPVNGMLRYNTDTLRFEFYANGAWREVFRRGGDTMTGYIAPAAVTLTYGATINTDVSLGNRFSVVLTGNAVLGAPTNPVNGQKVTWKITQDGTGGRVLTYNAIFNFGIDLTGLTLSTTPNTSDYIGAEYDSGTNKWNVLAVTRGY